VEVVTKKNCHQQLVPHPQRVIAMEMFQSAFHVPSFEVVNVELEGAQAGPSNHLISKLASAKDVHKHHVLATLQPMQIMEFNRSSRK